MRGKTPSFKVNIPYIFGISTFAFTFAVVCTISIDVSSLEHIVLAWVRVRVRVKG